MQVAGVDGGIAVAPIAKCRMEVLRGRADMTLIIAEDPW